VTEGVEQPVLRVVRGEPTADELAALLTVIATRAAAATKVARPRSTWSEPARRLRRPMPPGAGAWRRSGLPG
jgi:hypothetical protein